MNEIVNKFFLAGDIFMSEMHLREPKFNCSACRQCNKNKKRIPKIKETGDWRYIYHSELDKTCFQHDIAYGDLKYLPRKTALVNLLWDKALILLKIQNMMNMKKFLLQ